MSEARSAAAAPSRTVRLPWLPPGRTVQVADRGEFFVRVHEHPDPDAPWLLLLHGWTATADLQYFTAYEALAQHWSFVAIDHRGHGRGLRAPSAFTLEDAADDAAAVVRALGIESVITVGYSMGGPISMHLARRHPDLVAAMVVQATAQDFRASRFERWRWRWLPVLGFGLRSWYYPRSVIQLVRRAVPAGHPLEPYVGWIAGEMLRNSAHVMVEAGVALRHHDARPWAPTLAVPAVSLITTRDHLVPPRKQRALADALGAQVFELHGDHLCTMAQPTLYAELLVTTVRAATRVRRGVRPPG
ncbi:MAG: alpha/beta hydrolase [Ilumatobacteraceae bacterium]|nr:alpha/beta hydrolase [Ilumatobacteraceae bacterium]